MLSACSVFAPVNRHATIDIPQERPLLADLKELLQQEQQPESHLPKLVIAEHPEVLRFVRRYTAKRRNYVRDTLYSREEYQPMLKETFNYFGLPEELVNVAAIESQFSPEAKNPSGAAGMWQFMPGTARDYGLTVNLFVDERYDVLKSSIAAAKYLRDLHEHFGDWYLVLAAYNSGRGKMNRMIRRENERDFFKLRKCRCLSRETSEFVPKVLAISHVYNNLEYFGFLDMDDM